jgi:transposase
MNEIEVPVPVAPSPKSRRFPEDFKRDAVRLVTDEKYTFKAAAKAVGVSEKSLRDWHKKFAPPAVPCGDDATVTELQLEVKRLRKQLKRAEMEREILKKATAYFAKESQ